MKLSQAILVASVSGYTPPKPYRKALAKNDAVSTCRRKEFVSYGSLLISYPGYLGNMSRVEYNGLVQAGFQTFLFHEVC